MKSEVKIIEKEKIVIRFSGDSGDGMQLTGSQFAGTAALFGNDMVTFPDFPAEIRAPQGTVGGVSGFQLHFGHSAVHTPGDYADVLVAMTPAALMANLQWVQKGGIIILNEDTFSQRNILKAGFEENPLEDGSLTKFNVIAVKITTLTKDALTGLEASSKDADRSKNMFALGLVYWLFGKDLGYTYRFLEKKFAKKPELIEVNKRILNAGYHYGETSELTASNFVVEPAHIEKGIYRTITGNQATAWGLIAASEKSELPLFCGSYPITPATDILQSLAARKDLGVKTFQAEDEIAGIASAIGAAYAGNLAVTTTSGPGLALKTEAAGLAIMTELPLVIVNVQRGGPSTGLPTKTEQSDLSMALYGRNGESPLIVLAASTPSNCFEYAFLASKLTLEHMTPVLLLTDGFIANGAEPWKIPSMSELPTIETQFARFQEEAPYLPYQRDEKKLSRKWAIPGMKGLEHRIGGLEKANETGYVSHDPENHQIMTKLREEKVQRVADFIPYQELYGDTDADLLVIGWGGTFGHLLSALNSLRKEGHKVALVHFNYLYPLPKNTEPLFQNRKHLVVCELNNGQFRDYLASSFSGFHFEKYNKIQGLPFTVKELTAELKKRL